MAGNPENEVNLHGITMSQTPTNVRQIPTNHNVTGTCGKCGGAIVSPMLVGGTCQPDERCMDCGARPKPTIAPVYGPIRDMK